MNVRGLAVGIAMLVAGCRAPAPDAEESGGALLTLLDSVALPGSDSANLGTLSGFATDAAGSLFVSSTMDGHVLHFSRDGALVRRIGGRGRGPGEFATPVAVTVLDDSLLAVADWTSALTSLFDHRTGAFLRSVPNTGYPWAMVGAGDTLWAANVNRFFRTSLAAWSIREDSMRYLGALPAIYEIPQVMDTYPYAALAWAGDTLLEAFPTHPAIFLSRADGVVVDSVEIPAVRRRGVPADLGETFSRDVTNEEAAGLVSTPVILHRLRSGSVAVLYLDMTLDSTTLSAAGYLSVLDRARSRACVDVPITFSPDGRPVAAFRGDTLVTVEQRIVGDTEIATYAKTYLVDETKCAWVPLATGG